MRQGKSELTPKGRGRGPCLRFGPSTGSVSLELVGSLPVVAVAVLAALQLVAAGFTLWSAGLAARAGARAELTGRAPGPAVRRALPGILSERSSVTRADGVTVAVRLPTVFPGLPETWLKGSSDLGH